MMQQRDTSFVDLSENEVMRVTKFLGQIDNPTPEQIEEYREALYVVEMKKKMRKTIDAPDKFLVMKARRLYSNILPEFRLNIEEYVNDKPLSDIQYRGKTIAYIMSIIAPEDDPSFWHALEIMGDFIQTGHIAADNFCECYKLRMRTRDLPRRIKINNSQN